MTFVPNVPNPSQSPGDFPPQNAANFTQLKKIIIADHVFNDSPAANDGIHKQVTFQTRQVHGALPTGASARLYTKLDTFSLPQLYYWNGTSDFQLTPPEDLYPIRVVGSASLAPNATAVAYADPGFRWAGTGWSIVQNTNVFYYWSLLRSGPNNIQEIRDKTGTPSRPVLEFSGNNLRIRNLDSGSTLTCVWSLIINRIP